MEKDCADAVAGSILASIKYSKSYATGETVLESSLAVLTNTELDDDNWIMDSEYSIVGDSDIFY